MIYQEINSLFFESCIRKHKIKKIINNDDVFLSNIYLMLDILYLKLDCNKIIIDDTLTPNSISYLINNKIIFELTNQNTLRVSCEFIEELNNTTNIEFNYCKISTFMYIKFVYNIQFDNAYLNYVY